MPTQVNAWRTSDGRVFASQSEADHHENTTMRENRIRRLLPAMTRMGGYDSSMIAQFIVANRKSFLEALS